MLKEKHMFLGISEVPHTPSRKAGADLRATKNPKRQEKETKKQKDQKDPKELKEKEKALNPNKTQNLKLLVLGMCL